VISGRRTRWTTQGTTAQERSPGTIAATSQLLHVTTTPVVFWARLAPSGLLAWPVRNMAQATVELWYIAAIRNVPSRLAVGPGREPRSSAMLTGTGSTIPALRAVIEGTPEARVTSVIWIA
jgi:hypothetical protein